VAASHNILNPQNWTSSFGDELFGYAYNKTGQVSVAEDLVQETFLAGLKSVQSFRGQCSERSWLFSILKFKIADYYRKASTKYEVNSQFLLFENDEASNDYFTADGSWGEGKSPTEWTVESFDALENKELRDALNYCIDQLKEQQKQLVLLKLVEEVPTEQVCKELSISPTNYWVLMHRAKLQLRACLENNWINR
jgi:RNA polymerase sigma-70 factor (TIGR02943 family)